MYFYDFVYEALFEEDKKERPLKQFCIREYEDRENPKYYNIIGLFKSKDRKVNKEIYSLQIDNITLNVYETGIAVFAFHLNNWDYQNIEDINRIDDLGRRMNPQFLIKNGDENDFKKDSFIPLSLSIS